jgi:hypothetical protein
MSKLLLLLLSGGAVLYTCKNQQAAQPELASARATVAPDSTAVHFEKDIVPILKAKCSPCHFPGGTMYSKMPFDNPQTIKDHPEGILRRIKSEPENGKIKAFLQSQTPGM